MPAAYRETIFRAGRFLREKGVFGLVVLLGFAIWTFPAWSADLTEMVEKANKGEAEAQFGLAEKYRKGEDLPKNDAEAAKWYRKAGEQGVADAQATLGQMYREGEGVPKDDAEAAKWYRKAGEQGVPDAQASLGQMYRKGEGVPKD
ncbi:MAG TPA: hypothetical protein DEH27_01140, partial [Deltaproteobacteria bacterium]|nr:hypothetical protein [Deltaproteobacteria bacterium]